MNDIYTEEQITQEFLKEHLEYRDGHLWWIKKSARCIKTATEVRSLRFLKQEKVSFRYI